MGQWPRCNSDPAGQRGRPHDVFQNQCRNCVVSYKLTLTARVGETARHGTSDTQIDISPLIKGALLAPWCFRQRVLGKAHRPADLSKCLLGIATLWHATMVPQPIWTTLQLFLYRKLPTYCVWPVVL